MSKKEKRVNEFDPLPPNYGDLNEDDKIECSEGVYKKQVKNSYGYRMGGRRHDSRRDH